MKIERQVWEHLRDALGGDGWDNWTDSQIVAVMSGWMTVGVDAATQARDLIEDGFDPRDIQHMYPRA